MESTDPGNPELAKPHPMTTRCREIIDQLSANGTWEEDYSATPDQIDSVYTTLKVVQSSRLTQQGVTHYLLDLYITTSSSNPGQPVEPSPISPAEKPITPTSNLSSPSIAFALPAPWNAQTLTELKIYLRTKRPGQTEIPSWPDSPMDGMEEESIVEGIGRNEGTVRFVWDKQDVTVA
jgi:CTD kinase subunit beta